MAGALVGTIGAVSTAVVNTAVTPAWGTGESRTAGNLLICWVAGNQVATFPTLPTGWSLGDQEATSPPVASSTVLYKIAAGADAAPTIAAVANVSWSVQLGEFSGLAPSTPVDQDGVASANAISPVVATSGAADAALGELVIACAAILLSGSFLTIAAAHTLNNGASAVSTNNNSTSTVSHYNFAYGFTTGNSVADSDSFAFTASTGRVALVLISFELGSAAAATITLGPLSIAATQPPSANVAIGNLSLAASGNNAPLVVGTAAIALGPLTIGATGPPLVLYNDVFRYVTANGPSTAYRVATQVPPNGYWVDYSPASGVDYTYFSVAIGVSGSTTGPTVN